MRWILSELARQGRGWAALRMVFGRQFTAVIAFVMGLLLAALWARAGIPSVALGGFLLLLAIRAHDMGEDEDDRTELDAEWSPLTDQQRREVAFLAQEEAARGAQVAFIKQRDQAALGRTHDPAEL
jgi:hypothetical protein